jgi:hypothetical protein
MNGDGAVAWLAEAVRTGGSTARRTVLLALMHAIAWTIVYEAAVVGHLALVKFVGHNATLTYATLPVAIVGLIMAFAPLLRGWRSPRWMWALPAAAVVTAFFHAWARGLSRTTHWPFATMTRYPALGLTVIGPFVAFGILNADPECRLTARERVDAAVELWPDLVALSATGALVGTVLVTVLGGIPLLAAEVAQRMVVETMMVATTLQPSRSTLASTRVILARAFWPLLAVDTAERLASKGWVWLTHWAAMDEHRPGSGFPMECLWIASLFVIVPLCRRALSLGDLVVDPTGAGDVRGNPWAGGTD